MSAVKNFFDSAGNIPKKHGAAGHGTSIRPARKDHVHPGWGLEQLLYFKRGLNMDITTDQILTKTWDFTDALNRQIITRVRAFNGSTNLTAADGGIYTATAKGGIAVVAAAQVYTALTAATIGVDLTIAPAGLDELTLDELYLSLTGAQGGAATMDLFVFGIPFIATEVA